MGFGPGSLNPKSLTNRLLKPNISRFVAWEELQWPSQHRSQRLPSVFTPGQVWQLFSMILVVKFKPHLGYMHQTRATNDESSYLNGVKCASLKRSGQAEHQFYVAQSCKFRIDTISHQIRLYQNSLHFYTCCIPTNSTTMNIYSNSHSYSS